MALIEKALKIAERNLTSGNWKVETAQLFLKGVDEQPEQFAYLNKKGERI